MSEEENEEEEDVQKIMHVVRRAPHGTIYSYEGIEMVLIMASYDQDISMAFIDDGVYCLKKDQDTSEIEIKGFMKTLTALDDYDVEKLYVERKSMEDRGLTEDDFIVPVSRVPASVIPKCRG